MAIPRILLWNRQTHRVQLMTQNCHALNCLDLSAGVLQTDHMHVATFHQEHSATRTERNVKSDHRSTFSNLSNWKEEAWKNSGLQRDSNPWPPQIPVRCSTNWAMKPHIGHIGSEVNKLFSKMADENSNKSKLKTYTSTRKNTFTLVTLQSFSIFRCNISWENVSWKLKNLQTFLWLGVWSIPPIIETSFLSWYYTWKCWNFAGLLK